MAENAARVDWAGVGVRLAPRFCTPWGVRLAVRRALRNPSLRARPRARGLVRCEPRASHRGYPVGALGRGGGRARGVRGGDAGRGYGAGGVGVGVGAAAGTRRTSARPVRPGVVPSPGSV